MTKVSVVVPMFNVKSFVGEAISSALNQTWPELEVIVVDDGSIDESAQIAESLRDLASHRGVDYQIVRQANAGAGAARNAALARAAGELILFLDADDVLYPKAVERLADVMLADLGLDLAFPQCRHIDEAGLPMGMESTSMRDRYSAIDLMMSNPIHTGTGVMIRRARANATGTFDVTLPACIDLDFWVRLTCGRGDTIAQVPQVLADYRRRDGQITSDWQRMRQGWERTLAKAETAGYGLGPRQTRKALARNALFWATIAYQGGNFADARKLTSEMWRNDAAFAATDGHALVRSAACLASLLPRSIHNRIRDGFNGL